ncbi:MAG: cyclic nucleotide-binding domain-containing protein [Planctomycetes bacterium]|nr:cyclic nucleotide-binding domain-containing protein [Planctomycetota bacterium]
MSQAERPRRAEGVVVHEVASEREGERVVLEREGRLCELDLGERDAFVWARLDGTRTLEEVGAEYLEEHDAIHPDLGGLVTRLRAHDLLEGVGLPPPPSVHRSVGARLAQLAGTLAMVRLPIPGASEPYNLVGKISAPLYGTPLGVIALLLAIAGGGLALDPWVSLNAPVPPLLEWSVAGGSSLLYGIVALLLINLTVDKIEAIGQVALLRRGGRGPGKVGVSFDLGVPGIYMELTDAVLLPLEQRVRFYLVPLLTSSAIGGLATLAYGAGGGSFGTPPAWLTDPTTLAVLHKVAWIAWIRAIVQLNPVGPSPVYEALSAWLGITRLRREGWRMLAGGFDLDGVAGLSRREQVVLAYLGGVVAYGLSATSLGVTLLEGQLLPAWQAAAANDVGRVTVLMIAFLVIALPTVLAAAGGSLVLLGAGVEALGQSELFQTPTRQAALLGGLTLLAAATPALLSWPPSSVPSLLAWFLAAFMALACAAAAAQLSARTGRGWGSIAGDALALSSVALFAWLGLQAMGELKPELRVLPIPGIRVPLRVISHALVLSFGLVVVSWALIEVSRALKIASRALLIGVLACVFVLPAFVIARPTLAILFGAGAMSLAASGLLLVAAFQARGSQRPAGLILGAIALAAWGVPTLQTTGARSLGEAFELYLPYGVHLPLLTAGLLAVAAWVLSQAQTDTPDPGPADQALLETPGAAGVWALGALLRGARTALGEGPAAACSSVLDRHALRRVADGVEDVAKTDPEPLARRAGRAVVDLYHSIAALGGDTLAEELIDAVALRLPARGHEELGQTAASILPVLGALSSVPREERSRLLGQVVHFTDFGPEALDELADQVGAVLGEPGQLLIRQGEEGDTFYVLVRGSARVVVENASGEARTVAKLSPGDAFGEAALLSHEPRSASVWLVEDSLLLGLERETFAAFLRRHTDLLAAVFARQADLSLVREVPLFADLSGGQVTALCRRFSPRRVEADESVIRQGEAGDRFYLVRDGEFEVRQEGTSEALATLTRGDTFGEIALLRDVPRTASVVAVGPGELLGLERADFHSLLGSGTAEAKLDQLSAQRLDELSASAEDAGPRPPPEGEGGPQ